MHFLRGIMNKKYKILLSAVIIIFCMIWAINYRIAPTTLPITDDWATNTVYNNIKGQMLSQINQQNPLLPQENKNKLAEEKTQEFIKNSEDQFNEQVSQLSNQFKAEFQDEDGQTYLLAIDPYYYYRFYRNILERGHPGEYEEVNEDGKLRSYSNLMVAPTKSDVTSRAKDFHVYFSVWIYKLTNIFNKDLNPLTLFFLIPVIFAALSIIPAFFVGKEVGGYLGGLISATYIPLHMSVISRTPAGFSDTDIYNIFFPLLAVFFMIKAFKAKTTKHEIYWTLACTATLAVYSTAWQGWWYLLAFIGFAYGVKWLTKLAICFKGSGNLKKIEHWMHQDTYGLGAFIISVLAFVGAIGGNVMNILTLPLKFISASGLQNAAKADLWPNVFTTVAELNPGKWNSILSAFSNGISTEIGQLFLVFILAGIVLIYFNKEDRLEYRVAKIALLLIWIIATIFATLKGTRFLLMLVVPAGIALSAFFGLGAKMLANISDKVLEVPKKYVYPIIIVLVILIMIGTKPIAGFGYNGIFVDKAEQISLNQIPSMNDAWYDTLIKVKENSNETAIISSWWDFGHQFITISERGATADGAHQNTPQAHWLGKALLSNNLIESAGIIRMMNCDANQAFEKINSLTNDTPTSIQILDKLDTMKKDEAKTYLESKFSSNQTEDILLSTHCTPPESFLITSEDMGCIANSGRCSGKTGVWAHFGGWNFTKADMWNIVSTNTRTKAKTLLIEKGYASSQDAENLINQLKTFNQDKADYWISGFPGYITPMSSCTESNNELQCSNGAQINLITFETRIPTQGGNLNANEIIFIDGNNKKQTIKGDSNSDISIILKKVGSKYEVMYSSPEIARSTFTRLFYLENGGNVFEKFSDVTDITGQRIIMWKVNWENIE